MEDSKEGKIEREMEQKNRKTKGKTDDGWKT